MKPKKSLGQHFLSDRNILMDMVRAANVTKRDIVLEIGPGTGNLTALLAQYAKKVVAIEKDRNLIQFLREKFKNMKNVEIIEGDVLKISKSEFPIPKKNRYKIVANIPYYITGRFLRIFLSNNHLDVQRPSVMVLMVQREIAERIVAKNKKESLLSISVKVCGIPSVIRKVPRGAFAPTPKVDSAVIKIDNISNRWFQKNHINQEVFFVMLKSAFQNKRKILKNSIKNMMEVGLPSLSLLENKRPEELSLEDWAKIFHKL